MGAKGCGLHAPSPRPAESGVGDLESAEITKTGDEPEGRAARFLRFDCWLRLRRLVRELSPRTKPVRFVC
jgi:hypothetical protein